MIGSINTPLSGVTKVEFENWIKLATDNKINASNSWDVALIDYFHDLSVLREGDGINFQKASATLDGCVKIYTSRIDSAATETGRLLSGLSSKNDGVDDNDDDDEEVDSENEEGNNHAETVVRKSTKGSGSLAKSFKLIRSKTVDTELFLDPLFKKTLTQFDEGGAKSLLMNMLHISNDGRVLFDATGSPEFATSVPNTSQLLNNVPFQTAKKVDIKFLLNGIQSDQSLENLTICPSMQSLINITTNQESLGSVLEKLQNTVSITGQLEDAFDGDTNNDGGVEYDFGGDSLNTNQFTAKSFDFSRFYEEDNSKSDAPNITMVRLFNENFIEESVEVSRLGDLDLNVLDYFDVLSKKSWAGPEHWKISNLKQRLKTTESNRGDRGTSPDVDDYSHKVVANTEPRRSKEIRKIDFFDSEVIDDETLFKGGKNITLPRAQWTSETYHLLPEDQLFSTRNFIYLSLKPTRLINTVFLGNKRKVFKQQTYEDEFPSVIDEHYYAKQYDGYQTNVQETEYKDKRLDSVFEGDLQEIHESFGDNNFEAGPGVELDGGDWNDQPAENTQNKNGFGSQLVPSAVSSFKPSNINFARVAKRVDVKLLKDNLWESFNTIKNSAVINQEPENVGASKESFMFTEVVKDMSKKYSPEKKNDLSTSFCFICLLHLANENGFAIESNSDYTDLVIHD